MRIRHARHADIPSLIALEAHAVTAAHWSRDRYEAVFLEASPKRTALVIEAEAGLEGFVVGRAVGEEWEIENIAVAGPARRRGHGTRLLGEFIEQARGQGAQTVFLEVRESNLAARRLYEKWAFEETGRRKKYYCDPDEDAITYQLALT